MSSNSMYITLVEIDHHLPCPNGLVDFWEVNFVEVVVDGF